MWKQSFIPSLRVLLVLTVLTGVLYPLAVTFRRRSLSDAGQWQFGHARWSCRWFGAHRPGV